MDRQNTNPNSAVLWSFVCYSSSARKVLCSLFVISLVTLLSACATGPTQKEIESADYGPRPENPQKIAEEWVKQHLIDPQSARFNHFENVRRGYTSLGTALLRPTETAFGWVQCGTVNAKNRMGGYTGAEHYYVTIKYGHVVQGLIDSSLPERGNPAKNTCSDVWGAK